jgi:hypothetical protein
LPDSQRVTRSTTADGSGPASGVAALSTTSGACPTWVSADRCAIAVSGDRGGTLGRLDLWLATAPPP